MSDPMFTSGTLDFYLREVAKAYKKLDGKEMPAEIVLIGGAAILAAYGFSRYRLFRTVGCCALMAWKQGQASP